MILSRLDLRRRRGGGERFVVPRVPLAHQRCANARIASLSRILASLAWVRRTPKTVRFDREAVFLDRLLSRPTPGRRRRRRRRRGRGRHRRRRRRLGRPRSSSTEHPSSSPSRPRMRRPILGVVLGRPRRRAYKPSRSLPRRSPSFEFTNDIAAGRRPHPRRRRRLHRSPTPEGRRELLVIEIADHATLIGRQPETNERRRDDRTNEDEATDERTNLDPATTAWDRDVRDSTSRSSRTRASTPSTAEWVSSTSIPPSPLNPKPKPRRTLGSVATHLSREDFDSFRP